METKLWLERWKAGLTRAFRGRPGRSWAGRPLPSDVLAERLATESERFAIVVLKPDDAPALRALTDDPAITSVISFLKTPFALEDARSLIGANMTSGDGFMGLRRKADHALVGVIGAHLREEKTIELGYWIGAAYHNQGYATEALKAVMGKLAENLPGRQAFAECTPENVASVRVLEKLGFHQTSAAGARPGRVIFALRPQLA